MVGSRAIENIENKTQREKMNWNKAQKNQGNEYGKKNLKRV